MRNPKDSSRLYFMRRHLQLAHAKGVLSALEYHAALEFMLDREEEALRGQQSHVPFHYEKAELLDQGLRVLERHRVLSPTAVDSILAIPISEEAPVTPIFDDPAAADPDLVDFLLLCPACETAIPSGSQTCPACDKSIIE